MRFYLYIWLRYVGRWRFVKRNDKNEGNRVGRDICVYLWEEDRISRQRYRDNRDDRQISNYLYIFGWKIDKV